MENTVDILGIKINKCTIDEAVAKISDMARDGGRHCVFTPNSEMIMAAYKNPDFAEILNNADLLTADGIGVVYASKILGSPIETRAAGYDISLKLFEEGVKKDFTFYFFGAAPGIATTAKEKLEEKYPSIKIIGTHDGYFDAAEEERLINDINEKSPDVLFVCLGSPKQELWISNHIGKINAGVCMGLGGCLDVYAGNVKRAPDIFIKLGLEWLYRLSKQPSRFIRMLALPKFMLTVIFTKLGGKK